MGSVLRSHRRWGARSGGGSGRRRRPPGSSDKPQGWSGRGGWRYHPAAPRL